MVPYEVSRSEGGSSSADCPAARRCATDVFPSPLLFNHCCEVQAVVCVFAYVCGVDNYGSCVDEFFYFFAVKYFDGCVDCCLSQEYRVVGGCTRVCSFFNLQYGFHQAVYSAYFDIGESLLGAYLRCTQSHIVIVAENSDYVFVCLQEILCGRYCFGAVIVAV